MKRNRIKGSVLVFTLMITTVLLSIGFVFLDIIHRETQRQSYSEKSQRAFLIADTAWECTIYNDFQLESFLFNNKSTPLECDSLGRDIKVYGYRSVWAGRYVPKTTSRSACDSSTGVSYSFVVTEGDESNPAACAEVGVNKKCGESGIETTISVLGYDLCESPTTDDETGKRGEVSRRFVIKYDEP